jgi:HK97 family phage prohead protease
MATTENTEFRSIKASHISLRAGANGKGKTLVGKIAYDSESEELGGFYEVMQAGCFTESLRSTEVLCYWSHNTDLILGRQSNGTLRIKDTPSALTFECDLDDTSPTGQMAIAALKRGDVKGNSFGFAVAGDDGDEWRLQPDGTVLRTVKRALLYEVSPVGVPAYSANDSYLRSASMPDDIRQKLEQHKRDADGIANADDSDADADDDYDSVLCECSCSNCRSEDHADCNAKTRCAKRSWIEANCDCSDPDADPDCGCDDDARALLQKIIFRKLSLI